MTAIKITNVYDSRELINSIITYSPNGECAMCAGVLTDSLDDDVIENIVDAILDNIQDRDATCIPHSNIGECYNETAIRDIATATLKSLGGFKIGN